MPQETLCSPHIDIIFGADLHFNETAEDIDLMGPGAVPAWIVSSVQFRSPHIRAASSDVSRSSCLRFRARGCQDACLACAYRHRFGTSFFLSDSQPGPLLTVRSDW